MTDRVGEGRPSPTVLDIDIRTKRKERLDHGDLPFTRGHMEGGALVIIGLVDVQRDAAIGVVEQSAHEVDLAIRRRVEKLKERALLALLD